ncbi:MAG: site-specific integrase [Chloroflexota bacterium]
MTEIIQMPRSTGNIVLDSTPASKQAQYDSYWHRLFDIPGAVAQLDLHLADLGSDQNSEKHTRNNYERDLRYFINWAGPKLERDALLKMTVYELAQHYPVHRMPSPGLLRGYIAHLKRGRGLKKATVDRYLAPVRLYVKFLRRQMIPVSGDGRQIVADCKDLMAMALEEKVAKTESHGDTPALYQHGNRLTAAQVDSIFVELSKQAQHSLKAKRDLALLYLGFNSALRNAEIRRLTLANIKQGANTLEIVVRGKRNKLQPVPLDEAGYKLILHWVEAYNAGLDDNDARRITDDTPIFQSMQRGDNYCKIGVRGFTPQRGLCSCGLKHAVGARAEEVTGMCISPHDMRRTAAYIGYVNGMDYEEIRALLRHESIETTRGYVGKPQDLRKSLLSARVSWSIDIPAAS